MPPTAPTSSSTVLPPPSHFAPSTAPPAAPRPPPSPIGAPPAPPGFLPTLSTVDLPLRPTTPSAPSPALHTPTRIQHPYLDQSTADAGTEVAREGGVPPQQAGEGARGVRGAGREGCAGEGPRRFRPICKLQATVHSP